MQLNTEEFSEYQHQAIHALIDLNDQCEREYRISSWPRWDYDMDAGTLIFSEEGIPRVITSVQVVGTTSNELKNWLWGWANANLPSRVTSGLAEVRSFGETEGVPQLTEAASPGDEDLAWEMTAVTARILGAKGAYRCPFKDGFTYFVYTDIRFATDADKSTAKHAGKSQIECASHGQAFSTYICEHLAANPCQEWFSRDPEESNPWPDAWCKQCDIEFQEQGEWNERNEGKVKIKILCHNCYEAARKKQTTEN